MKSVLFLLLILGAFGCVNENCPDCGPCGLRGGPATNDELTVAPNIGDDGSIRVFVGAAHAGDCAGGETMFLLDGDVLEVAPSDHEPQASPANGQTGRYNFPGDPRTMMERRFDDDLRVVLTFFDGDDVEIAVGECVHTAGSPDCLVL